MESSLCNVSEGHSYFKFLTVDLIELKLLTSTLTRHGLEGPAVADSVSYVAVESVVRDLMEASQSPSSLNQDPRLKAELLLNLILNLYDRSVNAEEAIDTPYNVCQYLCITVVKPLSFGKN